MNKRVSSQVFNKYKSIKSIKGVLKYLMTLPNVASTNTQGLANEIVSCLYLK